MKPKKPRSCIALGDEPKIGILWGRAAMEAIARVDVDWADYGRTGFPLPVIITGEVYPWRQLERQIDRIRRSGRSRQMFFFRHGETEYNALGLVTGQHNPKLTSSGEMQAQALGSALPHQLDMAFSSALARAKDTMQIALAQRFPRPPMFVDARLNEVGLGQMEGQPRVHLDAFAEGDLDFAPLGGESYRQAAQRLFSFLVDVWDGPTPPSDHSVSVAFCHAGVLRILASLVSRPHNPAEMFALDISNAQGLLLNSDAIKLPRFWVTQSDANWGVARGDRRDRARV